MGNAVTSIFSVSAHSARLALVGNSRKDGRVQRDKIFSIAETGNPYFATDSRGVRVLLRKTEA